MLAHSKTPDPVYSPDGLDRLTIDVVPAAPSPNAADRDKAEDAGTDEDKKAGRTSDSAIWWSRWYANWLSTQDVLVEPTSVEDMIAQIKNSVGEGDCIGRLVIRAHGSSGSVAVGNGGNGTQRIGRNIDPLSPNYDPNIAQALSDLAPLMCEDAEVILWSCNTGKDARYLQLLANLLDAKVSGLDSRTDDHIYTGGWVGDWHTATPGKEPPPPATPPAPTDTKGKTK